MSTDHPEPRLHIAKPDELRGRVILVTGAGAGVGAAVARACARHGAEVVLAGRTVKHLEATYDAIVASGHGEPIIAPLDLEKATAREYDAIAAAIAERYGRLDGLAHVAGILGDLAPIEHYDVPLWTRVMHVNVTAPFVLTQVLLPLMREAADASIVFTSSSVGRRGRAYWGAYAVSKFATEGLAQVLADEHTGSPRIRVNVVNPGAVRTAMRRKAYPAEDQNALTAPEEVTAAYVCLLGPGADGASGLSVDAQAPKPGYPAAVVPAPRA